MYVVRVEFSECYVVMLLIVRYVSQGSRYLIMKFCCKRVIFL